MGFLISAFMNIYDIIKSWYEFKAENSKITGNHTDLFFYILDLNNRLAWKEVFGLPSIETSQFLGIGYNTFRKIFDDLIDLGIIKLIKKAANQYTANQISIEPLCQKLLKQPKSTYKAFVKAQQKQVNSTCNIDIQYYNKTILQLDILKAENEILKNKIKELELNQEASKVSIYSNEVTELNEWSKEFFHEKFIGENSLDSFDKLIRIDNYSANEIKAAITWARNDDFWTSNFLSPLKLRNKDKNGVKYIDIFLAKNLKNGKNRPSNKEACTQQQLAEVIIAEFGNQG